MKRLLALLATVAILGCIYARVDRHALAANIAHTRGTWFALALLMFVPQIIAMAYRWKRMVSVIVPISMAECVSLILASQTMNLVFPSKMGDLSKAVFLKTSGQLDLKRSASIVVFEKMLDVAALSVLMLIGVVLLFGRGQASGIERHAAIIAGVIGIIAVAVVTALYFIDPAKLPGFPMLMELLSKSPRLAKIRGLFETAHQVVVLLQSRGARRGEIVALSGAIWILHMVQIYFFFLSMNAPAAISHFLSLVPLAIFIGLLPVSIAGFGTRDAALIYFFKNDFAPAVMVGTALYVNLRYIVPAIIGIPFLNRYITGARSLRQELTAAKDHQ